LPHLSPILLSATFHQVRVRIPPVTEGREVPPHLTSGVAGGRPVDERDFHGLVVERESRTPPTRTRKTLDAEEIGHRSIRAAADLGLRRPVLDSALPSVCKPPPCPPFSYNRIVHSNLELALGWVARQRNHRRGDS
jgi:hypothetical protein